MAAVSASPSWVTTTLQYLQARYPRHYNAALGMPDADGKLFKALENMGFERVESELANEDAGAYRDRLAQRVKFWDDELHRQMHEFLEEGGERAARKKAGPLLAKAKPKVKKVSATERAEKILEEVEASLKPHSEHTPERELEAIVQEVEMEKDPRLGSW